MLLGNVTTKLDEKGRLAIPKRFRDELTAELVISRWYENCLLITPKKQWRAMVSRLTGGELATLGARDTDRFLLAGSFEIRLDKQGRFVIPPEAREYAKIVEDVVCAGLGDKLEVWDKGVWQGREKMIIEQAAEQVEKLYKERRKE